MSQAALQRCVIIKLPATVAPTQPVAVPPSGGSEPHYVMSPKTATGFGSTGINFFLEAIVGESAGPYAVTLWKRDPTNRRWANWITIPALPADTWMTVCSLNASELYWQISPSVVDGAGNSFLHVEEIGG